MKKYLLLPFAAALMVSPALAQSSTNNDNLKPHEDVVKGAEDSSKASGSGAAVGSGKSSTTSTSTNSSNLKDETSTVKGAEESSTKKLPAGSTSGGGAADSSGSSTNSGNLKP